MPSVTTEVGDEAGDVAGCHPEEVAGTMEVRPGAVAVAVEAATEGDVVGVGVGVGVGVAAAHPLDEHG